MLWRWNLARLCISMRPIIWEKIWVPSLGRSRVWPKIILKTPPKLFFLAYFLGIFSTIWKIVIHVIPNNGLHYCSKFSENLTAFAGFMVQKPPKSPPKWHFSLIGKHLNLHYFGITNAILMKLSTITYLHETFHLAQYCSPTHWG